MREVGEETEHVWSQRSSTPYRLYAYESLRVVLAAGKACIESRTGFIVFTRAEQGRTGMKSLTRGPACHPAMILVVLSIVTSVVEYTGKKW